MSKLQYSYIWALYTEVISIDTHVTTEINIKKPWLFINSNGEIIKEITDPNATAPIKDLLYNSRNFATFVGADCRNI